MTMVIFKFRVQIDDDALRTPEALAAWEDRRDVSLFDDQEIAARIKVLLSRDLGLPVSVDPVPAE